MALTRAEHLAAAEQHLKRAENWREYGGDDRDQRIQAATDTANAHIALADTVERQPKH